MGQTTSHRGGHKQILNPGSGQIVSEVAFPFYTIYEQKTLYGFPRRYYSFNFISQHETLEVFITTVLALLPSALFLPLSLSFSHTQTHTHTQFSVTHLKRK